MADDEYLEIARQSLRWIRSWGDRRSGGRVGLVRLMDEQGVGDRLEAFDMGVAFSLMVEYDWRHDSPDEDDQ